MKPPPLIELSEFRLAEVNHLLRCYNTTAVRRNVPFYTFLLWFIFKCSNRRRPQFDWQVGKVQTAFDRYPMGAIDVHYRFRHWNSFNFINHRSKLVNQLAKAVHLCLYGRLFLNIFRWLSNNTIECSWNQVNSSACNHWIHWLHDKWSLRSMHHRRDFNRILGIASAEPLENWRSFKTKRTFYNNMEMSVETFIRRESYIVCAAHYWQ